MTARQSRERPMLNFKVVLLGEGCVGKTSLVLRYMEDKFNPQHLSTLQASFVTKKVALSDDGRAQLNIWDTAGQERFHALGPIYYRGSDGALLVYDITDHDSFKKVKSWVRELKQMRGSEITIVIVGNKTDLEEQRAVAYNEALEYARIVGAQYLETSAKDNEGVNEVFELLTELMAEHQSKQENDPNALRLQSSTETETESSQQDPRTLQRSPNGSAHRSCCGI